MYFRFLILAQVAERLIEAVEESSSSSSSRVSQQMSFFINFDSEDILRQANESTVRHQRGTLQYLSAVVNLTQIF